MCARISSLGFQGTRPIGGHNADDGYKAEDGQKEDDRHKADDGHKEDDRHKAERIIHRTVIWPTI